MTQYNTLNVKLFNSLLNKFKSAIKNGHEVTLNLSSNLIGTSNDKTNFPHKLLLTTTQVSKIGKAFANSSSANIKFPETQLSKIVESGGLISVNYFIAPFKGLLSLPKIINNKIKHFLEKKKKIYDTFKTADNSINSIKKLLGQE